MGLVGSDMQALSFVKSEVASVQEVLSHFEERTEGREVEELNTEEHTDDDGSVKHDLIGESSEVRRDNKLGSDVEPLYKVEQVDAVGSLIHRFNAETSVVVAEQVD